MTTIETLEMLVRHMKECRAIKCVPDNYAIVAAEAALAAELARSKE